MNRKMLMVAALSISAGVYSYNFNYKEIKPFRKCLLKNCEKMTNHNGGYCSAEHCKQAKGAKK